jgi:hypothetical protein
MRARELLLEYKRDVTLQKMGDRLQQAARRDTRQSAEEVIAQLEQIDPTANKQYTLWLAQNYIRGLFRLEDADRVRDVLTKFIQVKSRLEQKDINQYTFHTLEDKIDSIFKVELSKPEQPAASSEGIFPVVPGSKVLYNGVLGQLSIPENMKANKVLCAGTKWCTSDAQYFRRYKKQAPLYIWRDKNGEKYQFHFPNPAIGEMQLMDSRDRPISQKLFRYFRSEHPVLKHLFQEYESKLEDWGLIDYTIKYGERLPNLEEKIKDNTKLVVKYAILVIKDRWRELEPMLIQKADTETLVSYMKEFITQRGWPQAESRIEQDPELSFEYSKIIGSRFIKGEPSMAADPFFILSYAIKHGVRLPEYEPKILEDTKNFLNGTKFTIPGLYALMFFAQYVRDLAPDWIEARELVPQAQKRFNWGVSRDVQVRYKKSFKLPPLTQQGVVMNQESQSRRKVLIK